MLVLLSLGFNLNFYDSVMELYLEITYYGFRFILDGFMVLDIDNYVLSNTNDSYYFFMTTSRNTCDNVIIWHTRLGHIGQESMNRLARKNLLSQFTKINMPTCKCCLASKTTRKSFRKGNRVEMPLQLIHFDICGPISVRVRYNTLYFITFIDDFTLNGHIDLIPHKLEGLDVNMLLLAE